VQTEGFLDEGVEVGQLVEEVGGGGEESDEVVWVGAKRCVEFCTPC